MIRSALQRLRINGRTIHSNKNTSALVNREDFTPAVGQEHPWKEVTTNRGIYYWNKITNETTTVGERRPDPWIPVSTKRGIYYWNLETNQTTALGSHIPPRYGSIAQQQYKSVSLGRSMLTYATLGVGMFLGITFVGAIFR